MMNGGNDFITDISACCNFFIRIFICDRVVNIFGIGNHIARRIYYGKRNTHSDLPNDLFFFETIKNIPTATDNTPNEPIIAKTISLNSE